MLRKIDAFTNANITEMERKRLQSKGDKSSKTSCKETQPRPESGWRTGCVSRNSGGEAGNRNKSHTTKGLEWHP